VTCSPCLAVASRSASSMPSRLYFIGFSEPLSGNLRQLRLDAQKIARAVAEAAETH
jgi:hypothetical protein